MEKPFISIIIPNLNNAERLDRCLAALMDQTYPSNRREIILVDNGSTDGSIEISKKYPIKLLIATHYRSPYWCRNAGIRQAQGNYITLLDSNCVPASNWLQAGVESLQNSDASIVTGPVRFQFSQPPTFAEKIDYLYSVVTPEDMHHASALPATHLFVEASIFQQIGFFIPHIRSLGDIEWTSRANRNGYTFGFAKNALVDYPAKRWKKAVKKMIRLGGGKKELWVAGGKSVLDLAWSFKVFKNLLPPSSDFYKEMLQRNLQENMKLPKKSLWLGLWGIKLCRAVGMITKRTHPMPDDID